MIGITLLLAVRRSVLEWYPDIDPMLPDRIEIRSTPPRRLTAAVSLKWSFGILPKTPTRKLKVFQAPFGFFDTVVAAPSQAAALRAWGTQRNLFATGHARVATDEAAIAAALEHPGDSADRTIPSRSSRPACRRSRICRRPCPPWSVSSPMPDPEAMECFGRE